MINVAVPGVLIDSNIISLVDGAGGGGYVDVDTVALGIERI